LQDPEFCAIIYDMTKILKRYNKASLLWEIVNVYVWSSLADSLRQNGTQKFFHCFTTTATPTPTTEHFDKR
jgi:hypothetical protein